VTTSNQVRKNTFRRGSLTNVYNQVDLAGPKLLKTIENIASFVKQNFKGKKSIKIEEEKVAKKEQAASA